MGYILFILVAFAMLVVQRLVARHADHGHQPNPHA
jgi:hypothetical protein